MKVGGPGLASLYASSGLKTLTGGKSTGLFKKANSLVSPVNNRAAFTQKLEKHLDDVQKGKAYLSKGVSRELQGKNIQTNSQLRELDPAALSQYNAYSTAFGYTDKARYITSVNDVSNTVKQIDQAQKDGEVLKKELDKLVEEVEQAKQAAKSIDIEA